MDESQAINALGALAQETRLRILRYLVQQGPEGASAGAIAEAAGSISSRTSFHLTALTRAGLIRPERVSRNIIYRVDFTAMGGLISYLIHDCCGGNATLVACCAPAPAGESGCC